MKFYTSVERIGKNIVERGYQDGRQFYRKHPYEPTLYIPAQEETEWKSLIGGKFLKPKRFNTMRDASDFLDKYKDVSGFEVCGNSNFVAQFIQENYPGNIKFDPKKINIFSFDIEVDISDGFADIEEADKPLTALCAKFSKKSAYWLFGLKDYDKNATISGVDPANIYYVKCKDEKDLLKKFIQLWTNDFPDVVTGWNVQFFDIQYIVQRIIRLFGEEKAKELSPWGQIRKKTTMMFGKPQSTWIISGVAVIDYLDAFKKFGYKYGTQESYKLDHIAHVVLGEKKLSYEQYGSLTELYNQNPQLYLDYNLKDTVLVQRMEEVTGLLSLVLTVAYKGGVNYHEAFGTVGIWDTTIYRKLMSKGVVPFVKESPEDISGELVGGYVKEPKPGLYKWIVSFDLNSLYPHLMLQYNMSPETFLDGITEHLTQEDVLEGTYRNADPDKAVCANGACFTKKKLGVIPEIIETYYAERKTVKTEMLKAEQELEEVQNELKRRKELAAA